MTTMWRARSGKPAISAALFLIFTVAVGLPASAADGNDIQIQVETGEGSYALGVPVDFTVTKCNSTDEVISVNLACPCCDYDLEILDGNGNAVAHEGPDACVQVVVSQTWQPGQCLEETFSWPQLTGQFFGGNSGGSPVDPGDYEVRYHWRPNGVDTTAFSEPFTVEDGPCSNTVLCLGDDQRFQVKVNWSVDGNDGPGIVREDITQETGSFWFFNSQNVELMVKVLDGRSFNGHFWVFYGSLTDVAFELEVTDTLTGSRAVYQNPAGTQASRGDTMALPSN